MDEDQQQNISPEEQLAECQKERDEYLNGWKRAKADLINFQRDQERLRRDLTDFATAKLLEQLLPLYDSVTQAVKHYSEGTSDGWPEFLKQFQSFLKMQGVEPIVVTLGEILDHDYHEVVSTREQEGTESGLIVEEVQTGFLLKNKILRISKVIVSK